MIEHHPPSSPDDSAAKVTEHLADRPSWDCKQCLKPWPCDPAREAFKVSMTSVERAILMWTYLEDGAEELRGMPLGEIFDRFIAWTR